jgi:uncharacterized repeat protein (TIGR03803 family)
MKNPTALESCLPVLVAFLSLLGSSAAQAESTLHIFRGYSADGAVGSDASYPYAGLIADKAGNLYGTTPYGGTSHWCIEEYIQVGCGTVFQAVPPTVRGGAWTVNILYSFDPNQVGDGVKPMGGLVMDAKGNLHGTTVTGQGSNEPGNIYELSPPAKVGDPWTETNLYTFNGAGNGYYPYGSLAADAAGNLYGTTLEGGQYNLGTVYELSPPPQLGGPWTFSTIYSFGKSDLDGSAPQAGLILDSKGNMYGTTTMGGATSETGYGTVFQLRRSSGGTWLEKVVHRFTDGADGGYPAGSLLLYEGALYGTTQSGGSSGGGTVFQITQPGGNAVETVLYSFYGGSLEGSDPRGPVVVDTAGNLYGTTFVGGAVNAGTVFKLAPQGGAWTYSVLYSFSGGADGAYPAAPVLFRNGGLYGLTTQGGDQHCFAAAANGCGTLFAVKP